MFKLDNKEIKVHIKELTKMLSFIGEGVDDIEIFSKEVIHPKHHYWSNYITLTFIENANGNINNKVWNRAEIMLSKNNTDDVIDFVDIQSSHNKIVISFIDNLPLGIYEK